MTKTPKLRRVTKSAGTQELHRLGSGLTAGGPPDAHGTLDQALPDFENILKQFPDFFEHALTASAAAALIDTTSAALAQMRGRGTGPPYYRMPTTTTIDSRDRPRGPIRYIRRDIIEWQRRQRRYSNTAEEVA